MTRRSPRQFTDAESDTVRALLADGASYREIARTLDRHPSTIVRRFPGCGWSAVEGGRFGRTCRSLSQIEAGPA